MRTLYIFAVFLICQNLISQELISTAGGNYANENTQVSWSIGEPICETMGQNNTFLGQGFHQTSLRILNSLPNSKTEDFAIEVFPNPTSKSIKLLIGKDISSSYSYVIYNTKGEMIEKKIIRSNETIIDFEKLASTIYILKIIKSNNELKTFNIVKQ
jgi:hypothetical protein